KLAWFLAECAAKPAEAASLAQQALRRCPGRGDYLYTLGLARYRTGKHGDAAKVLEAALSQPEGDPCLKCCVLAMSNWQLQDSKGATDRYSEGLRWWAAGNNFDGLGRRRRLRTAAGPARRGNSADERAAASGRRWIQIEAARLLGIETK